MKIKNKKLFFYKTLLFVLILIAFVIIGFIIRKHYDRYIVEEENKEVINEVKDAFYTNNALTDISLDGYKVIGLIKIPKINLEYPILEKTTKESMRLSISRYWGNDINSYGNVSLAGHNNYDGTMFGKNKKLAIGDTFELTDLNNVTVEYEIFKIFSTDPDDVTILQTNNQDVREVTLITCTNGHSERLIIKAYEKIKNY